MNLSAQLSPEDFYIFRHAKLYDKVVRISDLEIGIIVCIDFNSSRSPSNQLTVEFHSVAGAYHQFFSTDGRSFHGSDMIAIPDIRGFPSVSHINTTLSIDCQHQWKKIPGFLFNTFYENCTKCGIDKEKI